MSDQFIGEIRIFPYNFAPYQWAFCAGQLLPISSNTALFSLLGTSYGGNGVSTFQLPDLRGRTIVGMGQGSGLSNYVVGQVGGVENVTLLSNQMPQHTHAVNASSSSGASSNPSGNILATGAKPDYYTSAGSNVTMASSMIGNAGGNQPFGVLQPYLVLTPCISLYGIFPSRN